MRREFVQGVTNYKRFRAGVQAVEGRGALEASMMLVTSQAGYGKTVALEHFATQEKGVLLRAKVEWTPHYFMCELAQQLGVTDAGRAKDIFKRVIEAIIQNDRPPIVVDEVNHCLARGAAVLEAIRDVSDIAEVVVVIAGHEDVQPRIARFPQIRSRVAAVVEFLAATPADIRLTADTLLGVKIADDLVTEILRQSNGRMREIMNALATVERVAQRNSLKTIALKDVGDQRLVFEWQVRRALAARA